MKNLSLTFCLAIAAFLASVGSGFASNLPPCDQSSDFWDNCFGKYTYKNGDRYIGEWRNNISSGQGTYIYPNGNTFTGKFKNGKAKGKGTFIFVVASCFDQDCFPAGLKYTGMISNRGANGYGIAWFPDGKVLFEDLE